MTDPNEVCPCGASHISVLEAIYCREDIETQDRAARREPKAKKPSNIVRSID